MESNKKFTLDEVKKLVVNAYEVGFCDGIDDSDEQFKQYKNAEDFWDKNFKKWINNEISYVTD